MLSRKDSSRLRVAMAGLGTVLVLVATSAGATGPTPEVVGRVPLVGLLPPWTWDRTARPTPTVIDGPMGEDEAVATARRFIAALLSSQGQTVRTIAGYRLDEPQLVAVVADLGDPVSTSVAFTVRLTATGDGTYEAQLVFEDR